MTLDIFTENGSPFWQESYFDKKVIPSALYFILGVFFTHCYAVFRHHSSFCWQQLEDHQARLFPRRTCTMPTRKIKKKLQKSPCLVTCSWPWIFSQKKTHPFFARVSDLFWQLSTQVLSRRFKNLKLRKSRWSPSSLNSSQLSTWADDCHTSVQFCCSFVMIGSSHSFTNPEYTNFFNEKAFVYFFLGTKNINS